MRAKLCRSDPDLRMAVLGCTVSTRVTDVSLITASEVPRKAKPKLGGEDQSFSRSELLSSLLANFAPSLDQICFE